jgi:hypothetical protein
MDKNQILKYEFCKKHLKRLSDDMEKIPFGAQRYGCGSHSPDIEHTLQRIHQDMFKSIQSAMLAAQSKVNTIIEKI